MLQIALETGWSYAASVFQMCLSMEQAEKRGAQTSIPAALREVLEGLPARSRRSHYLPGVKVTEPSSLRRYAGC